MNCEWAEEHLSEYLDNTLDSQSYGEVQAHLTNCSHCQAILDDYRRNDRLLSTMPRVEPPEALRPRIFDSPEYRALLEELAHDSGSTPSLAAYAAEPFASEVPFRLNPEDPGQAMPPAGLIAGQRRSSLPPWARVALPAAAAVVLALGGGYVMLQRATGGQTSGHGISTIGAPSQTGVPLAGGPRVVYKHDGALWSALEQGGYLAQQLTPQGTLVAGWAVAPITNGDASARYIAYIDAQTGALHIIRSDGQNDRIIGHTTSGSLASDFWMSAAGHVLAGGIAWSPNGSQITYLASDGDGAFALHLINADGTGDRALASGAIAAAPVWSADGHWLAYAETTPGARSIWAVQISSGHAAQLAARADADDAQAAPEQLTWITSTGTSTPILTWVARDAGAITGIFAAASNADAQRLSPQVVRLSAAAFDTHRGRWLAANGTAISTVSPGGAAWAAAGEASIAVKQIVWSSTGDYAALAGDGQIALWSATQGMLPVAHPASGTVVPVWSPDGSRIAYASGRSIILLKLYNGGMAATVVTVPAPGAQAVRWAPDGQSVAIAESTGVLVVANDGSAPHLIDTHAADGAVLGWSIAR
jgi:hypothetical protein